MLSFKIVRVSYYKKRTNKLCGYLVSALLQHFIQTKMLKNYQNTADNTSIHRTHVVNIHSVNQVPEYLLILIVLLKSRSTIGIRYPITSWKLAVVRGRSTIIRKR